MNWRGPPWITVYDVSMEMNCYFIKGGTRAVPEQHVAPGRPPPFTLSSPGTAFLESATGIYLPVCGREEM